MWDVLTSGESAIRPITRFDVGGYPIQAAGQVTDEALEELGIDEARRLGRSAQLAIGAARLAVRDAQPPIRVLTSPRAGVFLGTAAGPVDVWERQAARFHERGFGGIQGAFPVLGSPNTAAAMIANSFGMGGQIATFSSDCPSGLDAVGAAFRQIQTGALDVAVAGGADAPITPLVFGAFARSGMLAPPCGSDDGRARPFDVRRSGFVLAEAGAMLVLEDAAHALARGAAIYGEVFGVGGGRDLPTDPGTTDMSGRSYLCAYRHALAEAGLEAEDIDHVNAHAPGIGVTDLAEAHALHELLGVRGRYVPVTSIKGALGHPLGAAGVLQIASALMTLETGEIPPTANCDEPDPGCDLHVVRAAPLRTRIGRILVGGHGFGGNATAMVIGVPTPSH
jgi:3-oxoacyl-[acyl-carrier-protein] synthase II